MGSMAYPFSRLTFKDYDYTVIFKTCTDQIRNKKYKKGEGTNVHTAVQV